MMTESQGLEHFINNIKIERDSLSQQINYLPPGVIRWWRQFKNGKEYLVFSQIINNNDSRFITKNKQLLSQLAAKHFLEHQMENIDNYIAALEIAQKESLRITSEAVLKELPPEIADICHANDAGIIYKKEDDLLIEEQEWRRHDYIKSDSFSQFLTHRTSTGEFVRSKSEVIIYEVLLKYDLAFRYECQKYIDGYPVHPDFTIYRKDGKIFYWEHCGLMNQQDYIDRYHWKLNKFEKEGIVPWDNLILTYDDPFGNIDVNIIESEIQNKLLIY